MVHGNIATSVPARPAADPLASSAWWAGLPMRERLPPPDSGTDESLSLGARRLAGWQSGTAVTGGLRPDLSRWHEAGVGEQELRLLLGESPEDLRKRIPQPPEWLNAVAVAWAGYGAEPSPIDDELLAGLGPAGGLLALVHPLAVWHQRKLRDEVNRLARDFGQQDGISPSHPLLRPAYELLLAMVAPVLALHLRRAAGTLSGDTPAERFSAFAARLREPGFALGILAEHPTLARELVDELATWLAVRRELAGRLLADLPALRASFGVTADSLHDVAELRTGAGDTHRGGRSVAILTFSDGASVVYKPRGLAVETHFYELVDWLNDKGLAHPLRRLSILERLGYGWVEFVTARGCTDEAQLRRFYWRHGVYLSLLYALRASDMHLENVIAAGEHPAVVDLEATFQQPVPAVRTRRVAVPPEAMDLLEDWVLSVGLLPQRLIRQDGDEVLTTEISGLAGGDGQLTPMKVPQWLDTGTDRMRRTRARAELPAALNLAKLNGAAVDPVDYQDELLAGFQACYRLLLAHRDELGADAGPVAAFATDETRVVVLPTAVYGRILQESWHPAVLGDALDRECLFEIIRTRHPELVASAPIAASEARQLTRRDIPFFWTRPDSRDLHDEHGVMVPDCFPRSGLDLVRERIATLSEADLGRQSWAVSASLAALRLGDGQREARPRVRPLPTEEIDPALAVRAATRLGDRLLETAIDNPGRRPLWLTLAMITDRHWGVMPTGYENFSGLAGIAVFLGQLGAQSGLSRFRPTAEAVAEMLTNHVDTLLDWPERDRDLLGLGGFSELGGYIHTLTHLGALWDAPELLAHAQRLVPEVSRRVTTDTRLDVLVGTAGAALALRALHDVQPDDRTLTALRAAGERLLATAVADGPGLAWRTALGARSPLLGFSHGVSGIAYALAEIGRVTGEARFLDAAARAVRYEHAQYDAAAGNWPDHRDSTPEGTFMNAWCHGAAGIALARAGMLGGIDLAVGRADLAAAVAAVRRDLIDGDTLTGIGSDCLCHGDLGLAETLLTAGRVTGDRTLVQLAGRAARSTAEVVLAGNERCGVPHGLHVPGLLMGAAGIGYGLLRAGQPDHTPNLLLLQATPIVDNIVEETT
ncbi:type 2 lantipeptide synthetase LanM family protein [Micromonospora sp. NIE79]|uniref:Type 2 lantipeptide synthetase LanM family protein n=1 Tax=Micromonospora trifolii TaxID=2911208 RepID=A0ABS9N269_9ACTN|nr:type 2 lanthipeptide synthetase LanM family protein [Micromonospora trifolii]MCG5444045.1 type 2 lantipeptide synthetase LanM family protein [Micromonospora trifolii]